jgi:plastocyanin domain-containing protein
VPVRWIIEGREVTECNRHLLVPALGLDVEVKPGETIVEFTPKEPGTIPFSCWMGMLRGSFQVEPATVEPAPAPTR